MSVKREVLSVGFDKNGEADFGIIVATLWNLSPDQMNDLRSTLCAAIGQMERYWLDERMKLPENQAKQAVP